MIRVAYLINTFYIGGPEKLVVDLCNRLNREQFAPIIICLGKEGTVLDFLHREDVPVWKLDKRSGNDWRIPFRIARICREQKVDVLHSNNWGTLVETALACHLARHTRWLHLQHGVEYNIRKNYPLHKRWSQNIAAHWALRRADVMVAVSQATRSFMAHSWGISMHKVQLIYNGVELNPYIGNQSMRQAKRRELGIPGNAQVVISVGRLDSVKNHPCLVEAFAHLTQAFPEARLLIVGDGDDAPRIEAAISKHRLENVVYCLGLRKDVSELLIASDLFALASLSEGLPVAILEAMSAGLPIVATNVGGNPELVDDMVGSLVPVEDPIALAQALRCFLSDAIRRTQCGQAARTRVEQSFTLNWMVSQYESLYL